MRVTDSMRQEWYNNVYIDNGEYVTCTTSTTNTEALIRSSPESLFGRKYCIACRMVLTEGKCIDGCGAPQGEW